MRLASVDRSQAAIVLAVALTACGLDTTVPDGVVIGSRPLQDSLCVGIETVDGGSTVYWWLAGRTGCTTTSSTIQSAANVRTDAGNPETVRFDIARIPAGTEEIRFGVLREGGRVVFISASGDRIPTESRNDLDLPELPPFGP